MIYKTEIEIKREIISVIKELLATKDKARASKLNAQYHTLMWVLNTDNDIDDKDMNEKDLSAALEEMERSVYNDTLMEMVDYYDLVCL